MTDFSNAVALITGGGSGIGQATAIMFAQQGAKVAILDASLKGAQETVKIIEQQGGSALAIQVNVTDEKQVDAAVAEVVARYGRIDHAFNAAGVRHHRVGLVETEVDEWKRVIDVNLTGVFITLRAELRVMYKQKKGTVVNVSSLLGLVGRTNTGSYSSAKHAIVGLTRTAALEAAPNGVRVNAIAPGFTGTPMIADMMPGGLAELEKAMSPEIPLERLATPDEMANAVLWLSSTKSSYVVGHTLAVDGGFTAR